MAELKAFSRSTRPCTLATAAERSSAIVTVCTLPGSALTRSSVRPSMMPSTRLLGLENVKVSTFTTASLAACSSVVVVSADRPPSPPAQLTAIVLAAPVSRAVSIRRLPPSSFSTAADTLVLSGARLMASRISASEPAPSSTATLKLLSPTESVSVPLPTCVSAVATGSLATLFALARDVTSTPKLLGARPGRSAGGKYLGSLLVTVRASRPLPPPSD